VNNKFYVYEHWRTDRGECFYVGKGHGRRAYDMRRGRNRWHKFLTAKLSALGTAVEIKIIAEGITEEEAFAKEIERIAFWKNDGADLVNLTNGGDGPSGRKHTEEWKQANSERMKGRKPSAETKKKMSVAAMGNKKSLGKKKPRELVERLAALSRGKKRSLELIAKLRAIRLANPTFKGRTHSAETIEKISAPQRGRPKSEETKIRMRKPKSEAHKQKLREANLGKKVSEETRAKIVANSLALWAKRRAKGTDKDIGKKIKEGILKNKAEIPLDKDK
jgi:hypothetical protein